MSATEPLIYDSILFQSHESATPESFAFTKQEPVEELSSHLPTYLEDVNETSPFGIHSSVLDSVFSMTADDSQTIDHTPMFDDLDLIVDGAKVNTKDDWVSLFQEEDALKVASAPAPVTVSAVPELMQEPFAAVSNKRQFSEIEESFEFAPSVATNQQLTTPISSVQSTPLLDLKKSESVSSVGGASSTKVDHLGCVTYAKKQRTQPLPPVVSEKITDPVLLKRARNTEAARRSRARKMERMGQLEDRLSDVMMKKTQLEEEVARLQLLLKINGIAF